MKAKILPTGDISIIPETMAELSELIATSERMRERWATLKIHSYRGSDGVEPISSKTEGMIVFLPLVTGQ